MLSKRTTKIKTDKKITINKKVPSPPEPRKIYNPPPKKDIEENYKKIGGNKPSALMRKRVKIMKKWSGEE